MVARDERPLVGRVLGVKVTRNFWLLLATFSVLVGLSFTGFTMATLGPTLCALLLAQMLVRRWPRALSWRLAALGAMFWAAEEAVWSLNRLTPVSGTGTITDIGYYVGAGFWLVALLTAPSRSLPRLLVVATIPPLALVLWLLIGGFGTAVTLVFPFVELLLLLASLPVLGGAMRVGASEGRLLVLFGFFFRALGAASFSWLGGDGDTGYLLLWQLGYICLALGIYMELKDLHLDFVAAGVTVVTLQLAAARMLSFVYSNPERGNGTEAVAVIGSLAYLQLAVVLVILLSSNERHMRLQREQRTWASLIEHAMRSAGDGTALSALLDRTLRVIPGLKGIEVHSQERRGELTGYPYPLVTGGTEIGRLFFASHPGETSALDSAAPLLAARIQQAQEHTRWRTAALTDPLTGLLNRRGLEMRLPLLLEEARDSRQAVSVGLIDIDHFKRVNDVYGHATGDLVLRELAAILERQLRPSDLAVRWGGEEFLVVLATDLAGALDAMRRLRRELSVAKVGPVAWPLAASVGLAGSVTPYDETAALAWVEQADVALLRAKALGRNRIEIADEAADISL